MLAIALFFGLLQMFPALASDWIITNKLNGSSHNTATGWTTIKDVSGMGLTTLVNKGGRQLKMYWERGAANQTIELDGNVLVKGMFDDQALRLSSIRLSRSGSLVYLQTAKGPKAKVWLVQDGNKVVDWPRRTNIRILAFSDQAITLARFDKKSHQLKLFELPVDDDGKINPSKEKTIATAKGCAFASAVQLEPDWYFELICNDQTGRDIYRLGEQQTLVPIAQHHQDEMLMAALLRKADPKKSFKGRVGVLTLDGSPDGLQFYIAANGVLTRQLGEPVSLASDEAGKQSWSQSYRTQSLAHLYQKTGHGVFAALARNAIRRTISVSNQQLKVDGPANPACGWASKIYSSDGRSPISFFINQTMIADGMRVGCTRLGNQCPKVLREKIAQTAICLANHFEHQFDEQTGLYRIAMGVPFRFDGIWAPWNWQVSMARLLQHVGNDQNSEKLQKRADGLIRKFLDAVDTTNSDGALWRYWPDVYYRGWEKADNVSISKPSSKPRPPDRFEDVNHAGISLAAVCDLQLPDQFLKSASKRLNTLLTHGAILPRDLDGEGPMSFTWQLAYGWDCLKSVRLKERFSKNLASASFGPTLLSYAKQYDPEQKFDLSLKLSACDARSCVPVKRWTFQSAQDYLSNSPFFSLEPSKR